MGGTIQGLLERRQCDASTIRAARAAKTSRAALRDHSFRRLTVERFRGLCRPPPATAAPGMASPLLAALETAVHGVASQRRAEA